MSVFSWARRAIESGASVVKSAAADAINTPFSLANIIVPGGAPVVSAAKKVAANTSEGVKSAGESVANAATSAGAGIKSGFSMGVFVIVLLAGLYLWAMFRPPRG